MFFDLLHFGSGSQAINYFIFCFIAILGTIQSVAVHYQRRDLVWVEGWVGYALGALTVAFGFVWFFLTDQEIFVPGLAGGELFVIFVAAFVVAVPVARLVAVIAARVRAFDTAEKSAPREEEPLA